LSFSFFGDLVAGGGNLAKAFMGLWSTLER